MGRLRRLGGVTFHHAGAFWFGVVAVTAGVVAHLPMYLMGKDIGYRLVGMPMDMPMMIGMGAIVVGLIASLYGLYPRSADDAVRAASRDERVVTVSIGLAAFEGGEPVSWEPVFERADRALYLAKENGRDRAVVG